MDKNILKFFKEKQKFKNLISLIYDFLRNIPDLFVHEKFLEDYVKNSLSEGLIPGQIRDKLIALGFEIKKIDKVLKKIFKNIEFEEHKREDVSNKKNQGILLKAEIKNVENTNFQDLVFLAFRIFKVKPLRTILTILGIGVSFGVILFLVSLGYGLQYHLLKQISSNDAMLTLTVLSPKPEVLIINNDTVKEFGGMPHVVKLSPVAVLNGQSDINNVFFEATYMGVDKFFFESEASKIISGKFLDSEDAYEAVISSFFLKIINKKPEELLNKEIGATFFIPQKKDGEESFEAKKDDRKFKIIGIVDDETNSFIYIPINTLNKFNLHSYGSLKVKVEASKYLEDVRSKMLERGFTVSTISDTIEQANKIFKAFQIILGLFGVAALIVAVIGMINTMTISLLERIQEIGIMKVIGASDKDVKRLFLLESFIIGFFGGISGLLMGFLSSQIFNLGINFLAKNLGGASVNLFYYPIWFIFVIIIFASFVGILTGILPARRAEKMDPLQALRYK